MTPTNRRAKGSIVQSLAAACLLAIILPLGSSSFSNRPNVSSEVLPENVVLGSFPLVVPTILYGLELERYGAVRKSEIPANSRISQILRQAGVDRKMADRFERDIKLELGKIQLDNLYSAVVFDTVGQLKYVMVEISDQEFIRFDVQEGSYSIEDADGIQSEFEAMTLFYNGNIDSMLAYTSFAGELANRVREALTKEMRLNEEFESGMLQLIYTVKRDEHGSLRGYGDVEAVRYSVNGEEQTIYRFKDPQIHVDGFFTPNGSPAMRTWLESPVEGAIVSSHYNMSRVHPVLQTVQPHLGTDFAAPYGSPVLALSDGIIVARANSRTNGYFVKIHHDEVYQTQYLHLNGFARGIRPGVRVKKGDVIGYVGSTGLSTGAHVCLRFWKNGRQVNFERERLPHTPDLSQEAMQAFAAKQAELQRLLNPRA